VLPPPFPQTLHPAVGLDRCRERVRVEAPVPPRDVRVIDDVLQPEVRERHEPPGFDADVETGPEREVVVEQPEDVALVRAVRGRGEPEQESRGDTGEDAAVARRVGVVNLVHDDVVEAL
jgi:hypothetical protein